MARKRTIQTGIVMTGVKEYKNAIKHINDDLRILGAQLKETQARFKEEQNSITALTSKQGILQEKLKGLNDRLENQKKILALLADPLKDAKENYNNAKKALDEYKASVEGKNKLTKKQKEKLAELTKQYNEAEKKLNTLNKANVEAERQQHNTNAEIIDTQRELGKLAKYIEEAENSTDGYAKSIDHLGKELDESLGDKVDRLKKEGGDWAGALAEGLAAAGVVATIQEIKQAIEECVKDSIEFESAMAGVAKTTNLTKSQLKVLGEEFKELSLNIPLAASEIAHIGEIGGQLGIADENILEFTRVMSDMAASTNMTAEGAATTLAQLSAIIGVTADEYGKLGSSIVEVGNNFATTESNVLTMSQAVAGVASSAGMSAADIIGLSTSVTSLGITAQMGGTNLGRLIQKMQAAVETGDGLDEWAKASGVTATEFAAKWKNNAVSAIEAFISNLGKMTAGSADAEESITSVLKSLGVGEQRLIRLVVSLSGAQNSTHLLTRALQTSNSAWEANTALTREAQLRYSTTESKVKMFKNSLNNLKIAVGDELTPALGTLADIGKGINDVLAELIERCPWLVSFLTATVVGMGAVTLVAVKQTEVVKKLKKEWVALVGVMKSHPAAIIAGVIAGLATLIITLASNTNKAKQEFEELTVVSSGLDDRLKEIEKNFNTANREIESSASLAETYYDKLQSLEEGTSAYNAVASELVAIMPELSKYYDETNGKLTVTKNELNAIVAAYKNKAKNEARWKKESELIKAQADAMVELETAQGKAAVTQIKLAEATERFNTARRNYENATTAVDQSKWQQEMNDARKEVVELGKELKGQTKAVEENREAVDNATSQYGDFTSAMENTNNAFINGTGVTRGAVDEQVAKLGELISKYDEYEIAMVDALNTTLDGWTQMELESEVSVQSMIAAKQSQLDWMANYSTNVQNLLALDAASFGATQAEWENYVLSIADGSEESYARIAAMAESSGDNIGALGDMFRKDSELDAAIEEGSELFRGFKETADEELPKVAEATAKMLGDLGSQAPEAYKVGNAISSEILRGLQSRLAEIQATYSAMGVSGGTYSEAALQNGPHAQGLAYVPFDDYRALLHEGEMVLTKAEARAYRERNNGTVQQSNNTTNINVYPQNLSQGQMDYIFNMVNRRLV